MLTVKKELIICLSLIVGLVAIGGCGTEETPTPSQADLAINGFGVSPQGCHAWNGVSISVGVENIGSADAGFFEVAVNGQSTSFDNLPAGSSVTARTQQAGPSGGVSGDADSTNLIVESDETNNHIGVTFTPPPTCTPTLTSTPTFTITPDNNEAEATHTPTPTAIATMSN